MSKSISFVTIGSLHASKVSILRNAIVTETSPCVIIKYHISHIKYNFFEQKYIFQFLRDVCDFSRVIVNLLHTVDFFPVNLENWKVRVTLFRDLKKKIRRDVMETVRGINSTLGGDVLIWEKWGKWGAERAVFFLFPSTLDLLHLIKVRLQTDFFFWEMRKHRSSLSQLPVPRFLGNYMSIVHDTRRFICKDPIR